MEITEATLGEDHPDYAVHLTNLGVLLERQVGASMCHFTLCPYLAAIDVLPPCSRICAVVQTVPGKEDALFSALWLSLRIR